MRRKFGRLMWLIAPAILITTEAEAQQVLWQTMFDMGKSAQSQGDYSTAEKSYTSALENAERLNAGDPRIVQTMRSLTAVYLQEGKFLQAEALCKRALIEDEKSGNASKKDLALDLDNLAKVYERQEKYFQAESLYKKALDIWEQEDGNGAHTAADLSKLAVVYQAMAKYDQAEPLLKRALTIYRKTLDQAKIADCLDALANVYRAQGKLMEAEMLYKQSLEIRSNGFGPSSAQTAVSLTNLGHLYIDEDKPESLDVLKKALAIREETLGRDNPLVAESLDDVATVLKAMGRFGSAKPLLQRAVAINQQAYGAVHPRVAKSMSNLADDLQSLKDYDKAESHYREAISIDKQIYGDDSPRVANDQNSLALLLLSQGKYSDAEPLYKDSLTIVQKTLGVDHPNVATCLNNLALLYSNQSKFADAEPLLKQALVIRTKALGPAHPLVAQNLYNLACVEENQNKIEAAAQLLQAALKIEEQALDPDHPNLAEIRKKLAELEQKQGKYADAERLYKTLLTRDEKVSGQNSPPVGLDLDRLAALAEAQGRSDEASTLRKNSLEINGKLPGFSRSSVKIATATTGSECNSGRPVQDKWAVVVGISNFKDSSINLRYAAKDATDFKNYLINEAHFQPDHVKLLIDKQATRENIVSNLGEGWLRRLANSDDLVIVYLSTHGSAAKKELGNANFIAPYETNMNNLVFSGIPMQWLTVGLKDLIHCDRVIMLLDVCHGGASAPDAAKGLNRVNGIDLRTAKVGDGQIVVAASEADQLSWESKQYANGVFTRRLIEGLRAKGDKTTMSEAFNATKQKVEEEVLRDRAELQTPVLIKQWKGADAVIGVIPVKPRPGLHEPSAKQLVKLPAGKTSKSDTKTVEK